MPSRTKCFPPGTCVKPLPKEGRCEMGGSTMTYAKVFLAGSGDLLEWAALVSTGRYTLLGEKEFDAFRHAVIGLFMDMQTAYRARYGVQIRAAGTESLSGKVIVSLQRAEAIEPGGRVVVETPQLATPFTPQEVGGFMLLLGEVAMEIAFAHSSCVQMVLADPPRIRHLMRKALATRWGTTPCGAGVPQGDRIGWCMLPFLPDDVLIVPALTRDICSVCLTLWRQEGGGGRGS
jgi:hypothetical protein